jgi:hypothetical protein
MLSHFFLRSTNTNIPLAAAQCCRTICHGSQSECFKAHLDAMGCGPNQSCPPLHFSDASTGLGFATVVEYAPESTTGLCAAELTQWYCTTTPLQLSLGHHTARPTAGDPLQAALPNLPSLPVFLPSKTWRTVLHLPRSRIKRNTHISPSQCNNISTHRCVAMNVDDA